MTIPSQGPRLLGPPSTVPRGALILVTLAAGTVTAVGLHLVSGIVGPAFLALVLTIAAMPIQHAILRRGLPRWLGASAALLTIYVGVVVFALLVIVSAAELAGLLPQYADNLDDLLASLGDALSGFGVKEEQVSALFSSLDINKLVDFITELLGGILGLATNLFFLLMLILFVTIDAQGFTTHLTRIAGDRPAFVEATSSFAQGTRRYLVVSTVFGAIVAVLDTIFLQIVGVPGAVLWGCLAFITNYIPNIGFIIGLIPPALLALLDGGWETFLLVVAGYCLVNMVLQSIIQPKLVGDSVGLSATVTFLSLVVWSVILGGVGSILAVPLTLLVKALLVDADPRTRWVGGLLGDRSDDESDAAEPAASVGSASADPTGSAGSAGTAAATEPGPSPAASARPAAEAGGASAQRSATEG